MRLIYIFLTIILFSSCIVKKRVHRKGYYIQWVNSSRWVKSAPAQEIDKGDIKSEVQNSEEDTTHVVKNVLDKFSQDVYSKLNDFRKIQNLDTLKLDVSLELASAQHGCWLALYNLRLDSNIIVLQSNETAQLYTKKLNDPIDRVKMYTDRKFYYVEESLYYFTSEPNQSDIFEFMKYRILSPRIKYFGYWVIKYETKKIKPIWYLVFLTTD